MQASMSMPLPCACSLPESLLPPRADPTCCVLFPPARNAQNVTINGSRRALLDVTRPEHRPHVTVVSCVYVLPIHPPTFSRYPSVCRHHAIEGLIGMHGTCTCSRPQVLHVHTTPSAQIPVPRPKPAKAEWSNVTTTCPDATRNMSMTVTMAIDHPGARQVAAMRKHVGVRGPRPSHRVALPSNRDPTSTPIPLA
ncbi:hypothetical protein K431DRAFT_166309 [Polychaeton citri CBS 116435]|uniref:Uncharacterized protein n=1 Tax=Polychaeton citri CBS 116435 TaxID=1314669 RepID=A0A9P4UTJ2_9PEZI|nr:hypothetical protein K431DRAFT_166309 [Polychaeton citri CBS 116435]